MDRAEWLKAREGGLGASEAAAALGISPYMTNETLWEVKTKRRPSEDISHKPYVEYGTRAERPLRELFALDFPQYTVEHEEYEIFWHPQHSFLFATPDGKLVERSSGRRGGLEIKTTEIFMPNQWAHWNGRVPDYYYTQVLHSLEVTQWDYWWLKAQIKFVREGAPCLTTRHYYFDRMDHADSIAMLLKAEREFWAHVENDTRPATKLPGI